MMCSFCSWILDFQGNEEIVASDHIYLSLNDETGSETFSCFDQSCQSQRSRLVSFRGQLQPMSIRKLHVFVQLGLMITMDYQGKKMQVLESQYKMNHGLFHNPTCCTTQRLA